MTKNLNYNLKEEEQLYLEGMRAGVKITLECLKRQMPEFFDNVQLNIDMLLTPIKDEEKN